MKKGPRNPGAFVLSEVNLSACLRERPHDEKAGHRGLQGPAFHLDVTLDVILKHDPAVGMAQKFLNRLDVFAIGIEKRADRVAKCLPADVLFHACLRGCWAHVVLFFSFWACQLFS